MLNPDGLHELHVLVIETLRKSVQGNKSVPPGLLREARRLLADNGIRIKVSDRTLKTLEQPQPQDSEEYSRHRLTSMEVMDSPLRTE